MNKILNNKFIQEIKTLLQTLSKDKQKVKELSQKGQIMEQPKDL